MISRRGLKVGIVGVSAFLAFSAAIFAPQPQFSVAQEKNDPLHPAETFYATSSALTVLDAFRQADIEYYPEDKITAFPEPSLGLGTIITVERALPVVIKEGRRTYGVRTWATDVAGLLKEKNLMLGEEDKISPSLASPLALNTTVTINRVARTIVSEFEAIAFTTQERENSEMWRGEKRVVQEGRNGRREKRYQLIREDGELISKTLISDTIIEKVVNKIVEIGTKIKTGRVELGKATWYDCCGTQVASDRFKRGTQVRITNLSNGRSIIDTVDGCICGNRPDLVVDLHPTLFQQLGGTLGQGIMSSVKVEEILQ